MSVNFVDRHIYMHLISYECTMDKSTNMYTYKEDTNVRTPKNLTHTGSIYKEFK